MGPWYHLTAGQGLPVDGVPATDQLELRWFDHYLRGVPDPGLASTSARDVFRLGDGHYALPRTTRSRGRRTGRPTCPVRPIAGAGTLQAKPPASGDDSIPWQPLCGLCSRSTVQWTAGVGTGSPCETDDEVNDATGLSYDLTPPNGITLGGPIAVRLFLSTNGNDGLLTARIEDVRCRAARRSSRRGGR